MYVSYNWLKKYIDLPDSISALEVAEKLKASTVEVEGVVNQGESLENIVVGKVVSAEKHPNADKLKLCKVDAGLSELVQVVCGGSNVQEGMLVALAKLGAKVRWHGEGELIEMTEAEIRGVKSYGMICASTEIGLAEMFPLKEEKEILDLTDLKLKVGEPIKNALKLNDAILEIDNKSLSNRPDLWGHYGLAREVSVLLKRELKNYEVKELDKKSKADKKITVKIEDKKLCPRYMALAVSGIKVEPSPAWLQEKIKAVGLRPINNIVDITNYVMYDLGEPMHAFDAARLGDKLNIVVRRAKEGEKFVTLDEKENNLTIDNLVIATEEKAIALAGVMGGLESGVNENTETVVFEAANFEPGNIRKTSTRLGIRTDASARFEKSLDPNLCELALKKAVEMTLEICAGSFVSSKVVDEKSFHLATGPLEVTWDFIVQRIGKDIEQKEVINILSRLGFSLKEKKNGLSVKIPSWRATKDISIPEDIVEEVLRIYGYENIASTMPSFSIQPPEKNQLRGLERKIKELLSLEKKYTEVYNYSFVSPELLKKLELPLEDFVELDNPIAKDRPYVRHNLFPGLLENVEFNLHRYDSVKIFEIGKVFNLLEAGPRMDGNGDDLLPAQPTYLGLAYAEKGVEVPFRDLADAVVSVLQKLGCKVELKPSDNFNLGKFIHLGRQAQILVSGVAVGGLTEIAPNYQNKLGIDSRVAVSEIDLEKLLLLVTGKFTYEKLPEFPVITRDIAFVVDKNIVHAEIVAKLKSADSLIKNVELFDVFSGKNIAENKKSMAYHIVYRSDEKTLESREVDLIQEKIIKLLTDSFGAEVRR